MTELANQNCIPCQVGGIPLIKSEIEEYLKAVDGWKSLDDKKIEKSFKFKNFREAMDFANKITFIAEEEGHHPTLTVSWGKVIVTLYTHKIGGLDDNDFIMAAKIDKI
ncbi:MAG: 4a-hydroxytetrahydrobiopterin dehydratase [Gudongella sp.]|jgi:4a-hydroxytetrahydrobiopterin dehydratase|nr:4a-hydroxytetrahydrobiopterin dehydratase [Gudongella sp.]